jgi:opacity protein-like surface antigen
VKRSNVFGGTVGYRYTPSERFTIGGAAGLSYDVTTEDGRPDDDGIGFLASFDVRYQVTERLLAKAGLSHNSEPSGEGRQTIRNRANVTFDYQLTELTTLGFDARYSDDEDYLGSGVTQNSGNQRFFSAEPSVSWRVTDALTLGAQYEYRHKTSGNGAAASNAAFITLRYEFPNLSWGGF